MCWAKIFELPLIFSSLCSLSVLFVEYYFVKVLYVYLFIFIYIHIFYKTILCFLRSRVEFNQININSINIPVNYYYFYSFYFSFFIVYSDFVMY